MKHIIEYNFVWVLIESFADGIFDSAWLISQFICIIIDNTLTFVF